LGVISHLTPIPLSGFVAQNKFMGEIKKHQPVKLIVGMIAADSALFLSAEELLSQKFGDIDFSSDVISFDYTNYYAKEMGENLLRKFISFEKFIQPEECPKIKHFTNELEKRFLLEGTDKRLINLDPGYLTAAKLVLLSTKDYIHRIYLNDGIYAEITLEMAGNSFRAWKWTYPDYRSEEYISIFNEIRQMYMEQIRSEKQ
jgi:hypothetical protein